MADRGRHSGQQFGNYRLLDRLGRGGYAEVYLGVHLHLETQAAVKVLHVQLGDQSLEQFRQEARTIAHLQHPHIVRVLEFGLEGTIPFLVMDYAPSGTLLTVHPRGTRLPLEQVVGYVKQVAGALQYAHERHIIHRDVKPENMLLSASREVLLSDFGIAVVQRATSSLSTQKGVGTPLYMAPEQIMGKPRAASDQYSLAVVAYEWLCGEPPFRGPGAAVFGQHLYQLPPSLCARLPDLPPAVEDAILGALAKDPLQRFVSVQEFAEVLEKTSLATPPSSLTFPAAIVPRQPLSQHIDEPTSDMPLPIQPSATTPPHRESRSQRREGTMKYLRFMQARHSSITLPLGPVEGFALQAIFQPLMLRKDPIAAEDRPHEERRHLLGEPVYDEGKPRVIVANGEEALANSPQRRIVALGGPGTGKTTLLQSLISNRVQQAQRDQAAPLPIFLSLPDLARSGKTLPEYLLRLAGEVGISGRSSDFLWKAIEEGHAFVCLDSLDEVTPRERPEMIRLVNELASLPGNTWVIGSRFTEYKGGQFKRGQFAEWELQPLDHDSRQQLALRLLPELHRLLPGTDASAVHEPAVFVQQLERHQRVAAWGRNPLLFSLAATVFARTGTFPTSLAVLYQQVTDAVLEMREQDPTQRTMLRRVLAALALELYQTRGRTFTHEDLVMLLPYIREKQRENWSTEEMAHRVATSGILEVVARETYGFRHQTFQEYLAAAELAQRLVSQDRTTREEGWAFAWGKRTYSRWTEVLRLMVGVLVQNYRRAGVVQAQRWLRTLAEQRTGPDGDPGMLDLSLALESLPEAMEAESGYWKERSGEAAEAEIVEYWTTALLAGAGDRYKRHQERLLSLATRVSRLSEQAVGSAIERFRRALKDDDERVREVGVQALNAFAVQRFPQFPQGFNDDREWEGEAEAETLTVVKERLPLDDILALFDDKSHVVRRAVMHLLQNLGERAPTEHLLTVLGDEDHQVAWVAEDTLAKLGPRAPVEELTKDLVAEDWRTRAAAARVLAQLEVPFSIEPFLAELKESDPFRRSAAAQVLGKLGKDAPAESLLSALGDEDFNVRHAVAIALGELETHVPLERLMAAISDSKRDVREAALVALEGRLNRSAALESPAKVRLQEGKWRPEYAMKRVSAERVPVEPLLIALQDEDPWVRHGVVKVLKYLGDRVPVEPLVTALEDENEFIRREVVEALGNVSGDIPGEVLLKALYDENKSVRVAVAAVLEQKGIHPSEEFLLTEQTSQLKWIRSIAAQVLWYAGEHVPIASLLVMLRDEQRDVRTKAAQVLGNLGERAPIEPLLAALLDEEASVRQAAAEALGKLGERVPVEPLLVALNDEDISVREEAARTLGELGERVPLEPFLAALGDEQASVRAAAADVLGELGTRTPLEPLLDALGDSDPTVRRMVIWALGEQGGRAPVETIIAALRDEHASVRQQAAWSLRTLDGRAVVGPLVVALRDESEEVRSAAAESLEKLHDQVPVEPLLALLEDTNAAVRAAAIQVLGNLGGRAPVEPLLRFLGDVKSDIRWETERALSRLAERVPLEPLLTALSSAQPRSRTSAARVLGHLGDRAPVEALSAAVDDRDWSVSMWAVQALGQLGARAPLGRLLALLEGEDDPKRWTAAQALGQLGAQAPVERLLAVLDDEHQNVREYALRALGELGATVPSEPLLAALGDSEKVVREAAMEALHKTHAEAFRAVIPEAMAILQGHASGNILGSLVQGCIAEAVYNLDYSSIASLEKLTQLLNWPYWEVRVKAIQALGRLRRNVPDAAIRSLLELRHDPQSRAVRSAADDALAEILSLETGIEDD